MRLVPVLLSAILAIVVCGAWPVSPAVAKPAEADAVRCGTFSAHSRRCFFSFFQACMQKTKNEKLCHAQADDCRACNEKLFKCWRSLKSKNQCSSCAKVYDRCMHSVVEKQGRLSKARQKR